MGVQGKAIGGGELLDVGSPAKRRRPQDMRLCETHKVSKKCRRQEIESPCEGTTKGNLVLQVRFDEVRMVAPVAVMEVEAEAEAETAAGAQEVVARVLTRAAYRKEQGGRFKERCFDTQEARRGRTETSDSRRKEQRGELLQKKRLNDGGRKAMAGEPTRRAVAEARMLLPAVEPEKEAAPRACEAPAATCSELGSLLSDVELPGAFPLLELPEELQLLVAAHVFSPRDRAALCVAVPPLGRKAIKQIPAYTGPLMSLGKRVLSGGAVGEAEVRRYVREFAPSETVHPSLAFNECAQLNAIAAPTGRVQCYVTDESTLEWRLERDCAPLRSWKISLTGVTLLISPWNGTPVQRERLAKRLDLKSFQVSSPWPGLKSFRESDIPKCVAFQVKPATPTGREMGAANLEDGTSITALLVSDHLVDAHTGIVYLNKRRVDHVLRW